ncbi:MAG: DUF4115 domain-containing protein [Candidatus Omnitrophica bacterium]|nr:DUF4115 domain-containing protein [Candidatus Omnitrophota bacterium]
MAEQTPNLSSILKDTREAKGLTLEIVHEATKIPLDALKAIEQGYSIRVLTPFYHRGFIKIYAEFLGLNADEALKSCHMEKPPAPLVPTAGKRPVPAPKQPQVRRSNPAFERMREFLGGLWTAQNRIWLWRMAAFALVLFVLVKLGGCVAAHIKNKPKVKAAPAAVPAPRTIKARSIDRKVTLAARAVKDNWIQVKTDGKVAFAMTMRKGTMESWSAREQIELSGRNINELDLEVNGKNIGSLGSAERRAKRVVITKDGLTVKK